jgi:4'-phosphopantetheinyl transferase
MSAHFNLPVANEVHVWQEFIPEMAKSLSELKGHLSAQEVARSDRFYRSEDRARSIVARSAIRQLLGRYLGIAPYDLVFAVNEYGKPFLAPIEGNCLPQFNVAHSGDSVVLAVTRSRRVGIDVELVRNDLEFMELAASHFSVREVSALQALPPVEQGPAFFRCWTRKEAYIKAWGTGLSLPLNQFAVTFGREEKPGVTWGSHEGYISKAWSMFHLDPQPGYTGAVAVEGEGVELVSCGRVF